MEIQIKELTASIEDYLEAINILSTQNQTVRVKDIAAFLNVKMPSVNAALKILGDRNLIIHEAYGHVELTSQGREKAVEIYNRHKLILEFIGEILGVPHEIADEDACRVEHVLSEETINNLAEFMIHLRDYREKSPEWFDRFHKSMRRKASAVAESSLKKDLANLANIKAGEKFIVKEIKGGDNLKRKLVDLGITPDAVATIISNDGGQIILEIRGSKIALGAGMAVKILGRLL